jgi:hypothetical protein
MLRAPQKLPKLIDFNPDAMDLTQVRPLVSAACLMVEPAVESFLNYDKVIFDKLPDLVDSLIRADRAGESQDAVIERFNAEAPVEDDKGRAIDWRKVLTDVMPIFISLLGELLKPRAKAPKAKAKKGKK